MDEFDAGRQWVNRIWSTTPVGIPTTTFDAIQKHVTGLDTPSEESCKWYMHKDAYIKYTQAVIEFQAREIKRLEKKLEKKLKKK